MYGFKEIALFLFSVLLSMIAAINLWKTIIAYHFPDIQDYIGAQLIVCGLFLSFVGRLRRIGNQSTL